MKKRGSLGVILLVAFVAVSLSACMPAASLTPAPTPVTVQLQWTHQAEFAGFYAAEQMGYYAAEGLAVTFLPGGSNVDNVAAVRDGKAQFGTAVADQLIVARAAGQPLTALATIYRRSPAVFFALAETGITRPQDFAGKKIRAPQTIAPTLRAMAARVGVTSDQYTEVSNLPSDVALFASGDVPVWGGYLNALVLTVQRAGYKLNLIYPDDYGVHFYADTIFTRDDFIAANPDLVRRFLRASLKGWTYAVENPAAAGPLTLKYDPKADAELETAKMIASIPLVNTGEDHIGWMKPEVWAGMEQTLREQGVLTAPVDVMQVYTMQFLQEIYR
jgi:NitT/TauT family transport system substrate-binding protein